jgi:hypothetical protein
MAILTVQEVQSTLAELYRSKQALHTLDRQFNQQAATIMNTARQDVENLRAGLAAQRQTIIDAMADMQKRLDEGA